MWRKARWPGSARTNQKLLTPSHPAQSDPGSSVWVVWFFFFPKSVLVSCCKTRPSFLLLSPPVLEKTGLKKPRMKQASSAQKVIKGYEVVLS